MNDKYYVRLSSAITVLILLAVVTEVAEAPQIFKIFSLTFVGALFIALTVMGIKRTNGEKIMFIKVRNAFVASGLFYYSGLTLLFLRVLNPEQHSKEITYLAAALFFGSLCLASFFLGLAQATLNNSKAPVQVK